MTSRVSHVFMSLDDLLRQDAGIAILLLCHTNGMLGGLIRAGSLIGNEAVLRRRSIIGVYASDTSGLSLTALTCALLFCISTGGHAGLDRVHHRDFRSKGTTPAHASHQVYDEAATALLLHRPFSTWHNNSSTFAVLVTWLWRSSPSSFITSSRVAPQHNFRHCLIFLHQITR